MSRPEREITDILNLYAFRIAKAREVHAVAEKHGWTINLRRWIGNAIDAIDADGQLVRLEV